MIINNRVSHATLAEELLMTGGAEVERATSGDKNVCQGSKIDEQIYCTCMYVVFGSNAHGLLQV